ncbi:MAG TPA: iron ABC transporter permease [Chloroflexota bacterium]|nr:iron ABC transporter permease [Chloroflexota bacterium]
MATIRIAALRAGADQRWLPRRETTLGLALVAVVALFTLLPVAFVVIGSFNGARVGEAWEWSLQPWAEAFRSPRTLESIGYSVLLALRAPVAVIIGFVIAWLLVRVQIPGWRFIEFALWVAFFLPVLPVALGWILLLDSKYGLVNQALVALPFVGRPLFNINSVAGILWVHLTLSTVPIMVILLAPALRQMDATLEQAARVCGSGPLQTLRRVVIPVLSPAMLTAMVAGLIRGLEAFEVEQLLGTPAGIYVYATRVYDLMNVEPPQFPQAMALSTFFLLVLFVLAFLYQWYTERRTYVTISGRGASFRVIPAGRWRYAASAFCLLYIAIGIALPLALLLLGSFMRLFGFFSIPDPYTTAQWQRVFRDPVFLQALRNSLILGFSVAGLGILVYGLLAYVIVRSQLAGRRTLSLLTWLPWAVPGILLGVALLWLMLTLPGVKLLYGTMGALILALLIQSMPFGVQMLKTSFAQVALELEQASRVCGAGWLTTYRRVMLPLVAPMLVSIFVLVFITVLRDISTSALLAGATTRPLALLMLEFARGGNLESAAVVGVILAAMAVGVALVARKLGLRLGSEAA